jgi:hypothetical protein
MCEAKIRPLPNDTEIRCGLTGDHTEHQGVLKDYAHPGSVTTIFWMEEDRRTFRGDWVPCPNNCTLPAGHWGRCAP